MNDPLRRTSDAVQHVGQTGAFPMIGRFYRHVDVSRSGEGWSGVRLDDAPLVSSRQIAVPEGQLGLHPRTVCGCKWRAPSL